MSVTGLAGMWNLKGLETEVVPPPETYAAVPAYFTIRLTNKKRFLPSFLLTLECGDGAAVVPLTDASGSSTVSIPLTFNKRGHARVERVVVTSPFPVNFFVRWWTFEGSGEFTVFPRLLPSGTGAGESDAGRQGAAPIRSKGLDGELERIASYSGSEPLRMIHWKASARSGELMVKEFGSQAVRPLVIEVECLPGNDMEERISRAAWLVRRWVEARPVGLKLAGVTHPPATGRHHGVKLLTELALWGI